MVFHVAKYMEWTVALILGVSERKLSISPFPNNLVGLLGKIGTHAWALGCQKRSNGKSNKETLPTFFLPCKSEGGVNLLDR